MTSAVWRYHVWLFSGNIVRRLGQEEVTAGGRAKAVECARMLGAERVRLDRHATDRIAAANARVGNAEVQPHPAPRLAGDILIVSIRVVAARRDEQYKT